MRKRYCRRMLAWALAPLLAVFSMSASAVGLGEIEVESALNEHFEAHIDLLDANRLQRDELLVGLASAEDFSRVGVERFFYLTNIQFDVDLSGQPRIVMTSNQVISEPYLNFIVELRWPQGRLLKEYTVLLDPPTFVPAPAPSVAAPAPQARPSRETQPQQSASRAASGDRVNLAPARQASRSTPSYNRTGDNELLTTRDDTLWTIAQRTLPSEQVTVNQQMMAIQRKNPNAFMRDNINLLKAGYKLDLPTESEALDVSDNEALAMVRAQTETWRNPGAAAQVAASDDSPALRSQVDATPVPATPAATPSGPESGQVRIVANSGELSQGTNQSQEEANRLLESNETLTRQVDELNYQLDREKELAANQIALKDRQLEVKNQELAQLQERMKQLEAQMQQIAAQTAENQTQTPSQPAQAIPWWQSPMVLGGVIGVLVLLLAWTMFNNRRKDTAAEFEEEVFEPQDYDFTETEAVTEPTVGPLVAGDDNTEDVAEESVLALDENTDNLDDDFDFADEIAASDDVEDAATAVAADVPGAESETGDVIGEADIYVAYGRYGQAQSLLAGALEKEPERHDVRLKMLEVCVDGEDPQGFAEHAEYLVDSCDDEDVLQAVRELESRLNENVASLDTLSEDEPDAVETSGDSSDQPLALESLDDLDQANGSHEELDLEAADGAGASGEELSLDEFELEFDDEGESDLTADADLDDLVADLEIDGDSPAEPAAADTLAGAVEDDIGADLGGDLGMDFKLDDVDGDDALALDIDGDADTDDVSLDDLALDIDGDLDSDLDKGLELDNAAPIAAAAGSEEVDDFDFSDSEEGDINATKIDLAEAYIDMGDNDGARDILREVVEEGSAEHVAKAQELLNGIQA